MGDAEPVGFQHRFGLEAEIVLVQIGFARQRDRLRQRQRCRRDHLRADGFDFRAIARIGFGGGSNALYCDRHGEPRCQCCGFRHLIQIVVIAREGG